MVEKKGYILIMSSTDVLSISPPATTMLASICIIPPTASLPTAQPAITRGASGYGTLATTIALLVI